MIAEYLGFLIAASSVVALGGLSAHGGRALGTVKLALGVMLLSASLIPLVSAVTDAVGVGADIFFENAPSDDPSNNLYEKTAEEAFCEGVKKLVVGEFLLSDGEVCVFAHGFDVKTVRAEKIKIILSGSAAYADHRSIRSRVEELELGRCEVELEFG